MTNAIMTQLSEPFQVKDVKFRAGATSERNGELKALALAYIEARDVMNRLDEVVGWDGWQDEYRVLRETGNSLEVECTLTINGVSRSDAGIGDDAKAAYSDALKRAAVKFGVGRYLYNLPKVWVHAKRVGKAVYLNADPVLPKWAMPSNNGGMKKKAEDKPQLELNGDLSTLETPGVDPKRVAVASFKGRTSWQNRRLHALGNQRYGALWDIERPRLCAYISNGRTESSKELSVDEAKRLIEGLEKEVSSKVNS